MWCVIFLNMHAGRTWTSLEPGTVLNDLCHVAGTGVVLLANDAPRLQSLYIPSMGPAPRWCSFLDALTEELDSAAAADGTLSTRVFDDYKFLTREELQELGLSHMIGIPLSYNILHFFLVSLDTR